MYLRPSTGTACFIAGNKALASPTEGCSVGNLCVQAKRYFPFELQHVVVHAYRDTCPSTLKNSLHLLLEGVEHSPVLL